MNKSVRGIVSPATKPAPAGPIFPIRILMKLPLFPLLLLATLTLTGCVSVKTAPIEVKPIHITVDVNVKIDRALDDFFGDLDKQSTTLIHEPSS